MSDLSTVGEELFNKVRSRFKRVSLGDEDGKVTNVPSEARFFDIDYTDSGKSLGKISMSLNDKDGITIIYSEDFIKDENGRVQQKWYDFLREIRYFAKKRMLNFDVRNINKSSLTKRDYAQLARNATMSESRLYGTHRTSYQKIGEARLVINHTESVDPEQPRARSRKIGSIYIESQDGERFKFPYRSLRGARAMARHVAEGGNPYDDFGQYITGLNEESRKLKKFKNYVNKSSVMAESLAQYTDVVEGRIGEIKKTLESLQKSNGYRQTFEGFTPREFKEVPDDVRENWIDQLTIRQFNEELEDIFPYVYRLVGEANMTKTISPENMDDELMMNESKVNFTSQDIEKMMQMPFDQAKELAIDLISDSSMNPEKVEYFKNRINSKNNVVQLGKMFFDMLLSGEGLGVVGSKGSMKKSGYRQKFDDSVDHKALAQAVVKEFDRKQGAFMEGAKDRLQEAFGESHGDTIQKFMDEVNVMAESQKTKSSKGSDLTESVDRDILRLAGLNK